MKTICAEKKVEPVPSRGGRIILLAFVVLLIGCMAVSTSAAAEYDMPVMLSNGKIIKKPWYITVDGRKTVLVDSRDSAEKVLKDVIEKKEEKTSEKGSALDINISEDIAFKQMDLAFGDEPPNIMSREDATHELIEGNDGKGYITVEITESEEQEPEKNDDASYRSDTGEVNEPNEQEKAEATDAESTDNNSELLSAPLNTINISSPFGPRWGRMHNGTDFAHAEGGNIMAADDGEVFFSGYCGGYGNLVKIDHGNGMQTCYAHCSSLLVEPGQKVARGETIALVGSTGNSTGPHLHFEVIIDGSYVNPVDFTELE